MNLVTHFFKREQRRSLRRMRESHSPLCEMLLSLLQLEQSAVLSCGSSRVSNAEYTPSLKWTTTTTSGLSSNRNGWSCLCAADQQHMLCMTLCPMLCYFKTSLWEVTIMVQNCFHRDIIPRFTVHFLCFKIYSSQHRYFQLSLLSWNKIKLFPLQFQTTRSLDRGQAAQVHSTAGNTKVPEP